MLVKKHSKLIIKNLIGRMFIGLFILVIFNLSALFYKDFWKNNSYFYIFNLTILTLIMLLNLFDYFLNKITYWKTNKFTKWLIINKSIKWNTIKGQKYLALTKQNQFLIWKKSFFSVPLWTPFIEIPVGIVALYAPFLIFSLTIYFSNIVNLAVNMISIHLLTGFTLLITNLYVKNLNDSLTFNNKTYEKVQDEISQIKINSFNHIWLKESWTQGFIKNLLMLFIIALLTMAIIGLSIASKTSVSHLDENINSYPYFKNWTLAIFFIKGWKNALFLGISSLIILMWSFNLLLFIHIPWPFLNIWKKSFLSFNIICLNFLIISFWSIRFDDKNKSVIIPKPQEKNSIANQSETSILATTSSIINQINPVKEKQEKTEEIITRVIPLDMLDEEK